MDLSSLRWRRARAIIGCLLLTVPSLRAQQPAQNPAAPAGPQLPPRPLKLFVLEGQNAVNIIPDRKATNPVIEVRDENDFPVEGADVRFAISGTGAGGTFDNGQTVKSVKTNVQGQASAILLMNDQAGRFDIAVTATAGTRTARVIISQTNSMVPIVAKAAKKPLYKNWKVLTLVGAGAAAAIILSTRGSSAPPPVIAVGTPVFGNP